MANGQTQYQQQSVWHAKPSFSLGKLLDAAAVVNKVDIKGRPLTCDVDSRSGADINTFSRYSEWCGPK